MDSLCITKAGTGQQGATSMPSLYENDFDAKTKLDASDRTAKPESRK